MTWQFSRNTLLLVGGMSFHSFAIGFAMPNYPLYVKLLGASSSDFGLIVFMKTAALIITMVPGGWITDKFGPKLALLTAALLLIGGWLVLSVASDWYWIGVYSVLSGAAWGFETGAWYVILANENPTIEGTLNVSAFSVGVVSFILPDAVGSITSIGFFKLVGDVYTRPVLGTTFKLGTLCNLVAMGFYILIHTPKQMKREKSKTGSYSEFFSKKYLGLLGFMLANFIIGVGGGMILEFIPLYFVERFQVTPSMNSLIRSLSSLFTTGSTLATPTIAKKLGPVKTVCWAQSLAIPPLVLLAREKKHLWLAASVYLFRNVSIHVMVPVFSSITMNVLEEENRGKGGSLLDLCWNGGYLISPPISGRWIQARGFAPSFYFATLGYALSTIIFYITVRRQGFTRKTSPIVTVLPGSKV